MPLGFFCHSMNPSLTIRQRRERNADLNVAFSSMVSALALMVLYSVLGSFDQDGTSPHLREEDLASRLAGLALKEHIQKAGLLLHRFTLSDGRSAANYFTGRVP